MTLSSKPSFIGVDWGTSSFRAWAFAADGTVLAERKASAGGMRDVAPGGFPAALSEHLAALSTSLGQSVTGLPVVLCGMVGARQGWIEARYVAAPCTIGAIWQQSVTPPADGLPDGFQGRILPGVAQHGDEPDVMRGEETQLLGLLDAEPGYNGVVCMPGTHAKWVSLSEGRVTGFATAMTGELYAVISEHSVLRHSIDGNRPSGDPASPAFIAGLKRGLAAPDRLTGLLFGVRAGDLLAGVHGQAAADVLSGLLIGAELGGQTKNLTPGATVGLVASGTLADLYSAGLALAGTPARLLDADTLVRAGLTHAARALYPEIF